MKKIIYVFTELEVEDAIDKFQNQQQLDNKDIAKLAYGAEKWIAFKKECQADPSYQWGYGHLYY